MAEYHATVAFDFNDDDLEDLGVESGDVYEFLFGELQNFPLSDFWITKLTRDEKPLIVDL